MRESLRALLPHRPDARVVEHASPIYADRAFEFAAAQSGTDMLWRVADAYVVAFDGRAEPWLCRAVAAGSDPDGIAVV